MSTATVVIALELRRVARLAAEKDRIMTITPDDVLLRAAYGPNYDQLRLVKQQNDPDNVFPLNHIAPKP
jgi:hypothetical protein